MMFQWQTVVINDSTKLWFVTCYQLLTHLTEHTRSDTVKIYKKKDIHTLCWNKRINPKRSGFVLSSFGVIMNGNPPLHTIANVYEHNTFSFCNYIWYKSQTHIKWSLGFNFPQIGWSKQSQSKQQCWWSVDGVLPYLHSWTSAVSYAILLKGC